MTFDKIFICCSQIVYNWKQSAATDGVCVWTAHLTRHIFSLIHNTLDVTLTLAQVSQVQGVARTSSHVSSTWCRRCLDTFPLRTCHFLSHLSLQSPDLLLHLPCGPVQRVSPCALPLMRSSLTPKSAQHLSQVMSPTSLTVTTSRRPLNSSSRNPPTTTGP